MAKNAYYSNPSNIKNSKSLHKVDDNGIVVDANLFKQFTSESYFRTRLRKAKEKSINKRRTRKDGKYKYDTSIASLNIVFTSLMMSGERGFTRKSIRSIAALAGLSMRTVGSCIRALRQAGLIYVKHKYKYNKDVGHNERQPSLIALVGLLRFADILRYGKTRWTNEFVSKVLSVESDSPVDLFDSASIMPIPIDRFYIQPGLSLQ